MNSIDNPKALLAESLFGVIRTIYNWRWRIGIATVLITLVTAIGAMFLPNYYMAKVVFYPANEGINSRTSLDGTIGGVAGMDAVERMITFATSIDMMDFMVERFDLYKHYDIDPANERAQTQVRTKLESLFTIEKNKYGAIELSIEDKDKSLPLPMVNTMLSRLDSVYVAALNYNSTKTLKAYEDALTERILYKNRITDTLDMLRREYGIFNVDAQSGAVPGMMYSFRSDLVDMKARYESLKNNPKVHPDTLAFYEARFRGSQARYDDFMSNSNKLNPSSFSVGRERVQYYETIKFLTVDQIRSLSEKVHQFRTAIVARGSSVILAERPQEPRVKSRPQRSIIILGTFLATLLLSSILALMLDSIKGINWKEFISEK